MIKPVQGKRFFLKKREFSQQNSLSLVPLFTKLTIGLFLLLSFGGLAFAATILIPGLFGNNKNQPQLLSNKQTDKAVLAASSQKLFGKISFNIPAFFTDTATFEKAATFNGKATFNNDIQITNHNLDLGTGQLTASNVVYSVTAGDGIAVTGGQRPVVSNTGVLSVQGQTGAVSLLAGTGITFNGLTVNNTGVTSLQGQSGAVSLTAGSGISISGTTISSSQPQAGNAFGNITVGSTTVAAGTTNDTVTFTAGNGMTITPDATNKTINFVASGGLSGLTTNGVLYATGNTTATSLTPGTSGFVLQSNGPAAPPSWVSNSATSPSFSVITSGTNTSAAMVVGSGASLGVTGTGTINATSVTGLSIASGKTFTVNNTLTLAGTDSTSFTLPTANDTLVGRSSTDTLTNKTIAAGSNTITGLTNSNLSGSAGITNANLANSSLTVTAGTGLSGGGLVSLGSSVTLNNAGVTSLTGTTNQVNVSASTGNITLSLPQNINAGASPTFAGLTLSNFTTNNAVFYATSGTGALATASTNTSNLCLLSGGSSPVWGSCSGGSTNYWQLNTGALSPADITNDLLIGGAATASAKFQIFSSTGNATTSGTLTFNTTGQIQTTKDQTLTVGGNTTGNVVINSNGNIALTAQGANLIGNGTLTGLTGLTSSGTITFSGFSSNGGPLYTNGTGVLAQTTAGSATQVLHGGTTPSFSAVSLTADVTGVLPLANGGTGTGSTPTNGQLLIGNGTGYSVANITGTPNQVTVTNGSGTISLALPQNIDTGASPTFAGLTLSNFTANNAVFYATSGTGALATASTNSSNFCLVSGASSPTWTACSSVGTNYFQRNLDSGSGLNVLSPATIADTLAVGITNPLDFSGFEVDQNSKGNATAVINQTGSGPILTASSSGIAKFTVNNNGDILATGAIGGLTGLTSSGTITFSGFNSNGGPLYTNGTGTLAQATAGSATQVLHGGTIPSFSAVSLTADVTGILPLANGGTNANLTAVNGGIVYSNTTGLAISAAGSNGQCLLSGGAGTPTWASCSASSGNLFTSSSGAIYPINSTEDLLIGGTASNSAKFAILSVNSGTPTASVSAGASGGAYITASGTIATTAMQSLTLGSASTGNIILNGFGTGIIHSNASGVLSSSAVNLATADITGTLPAGNGGTGISSYTTGDLIYASGATTLSKLADVASGSCLTSGGVGVAPSWTSCASLGTNYWALNSGFLSPTSGGTSIAVGQTTGLANSGIDVELNGKGNSIAVFNQQGTGDIFTASASGVSKFTINNNGNLVATGTLTGLTGLNSSGTITFSGLNSVGVVHTNGSGQLSTTAVNLAGGASEITGILPLANGGTNANLTAVQGGILYSGSSALAISAAGTSGQTLISGGTGAPTWFAPTQGSILFAGASGVLSQNNANFFWDNINNLLGIGTSSPFAKLQVTGAVPGKALGVFNYTGTDQNILVASSSGTTEFAVNNNGNIQFQGSTSFLQTITSAATSAQVYTFPDSTGTVCLVQAGNCAGSGSGVTTPGGTANRLVKFTASQAVGNASINDLFTSGVALTIDASGNLGVGTTTPKALVDVEGGNTGGNAAEIVNQTGSSTNDIFTASASGTTKFTVNNNGTLQFTGNSGFLQSLTSNAAASKTYNFPNFAGTSVDICLTTGNCAGSGGGITGSGTSGQVAFFTGTGAISSESTGFAWDTTNKRLGLGIDSPTSKLQVNGAVTGKALAIFNETGDQALFTASASGTTKFLIDHTGSITASAYGTGIAHFSSSGLISSSAVNLAGGVNEVTGILPVGNGGTGASSFTTNGILYGNGSSALQVTSQGGSGTVLHGNGASAPSFSAVSLTSDVSGILPLANGGTNANLTAVQGGILYSGASALAISAAGTSGQALISGGTGAPTWFAPTQGSILFAGASGVLSQNNTNFFWDNTNNRLGLGASASLLGTLDARATSGTLPVATISGKTSFASLLVDNSGVGPIFAASSSGVSQFTIANNGILTDAAYGTGIAHFNSSGVLSSSAVALGGTDVSGLLPVTKGGTGTDLSGGAAIGDILYADSTTTFHRLADVSSGSCLTSGGVGVAPSWTSCASLGTNYWALNSGFLSPANGGTSIAVGQTTGLANSGIDVELNGKGNSIAVFNQQGNADIFTASASGVSKFTINNNGNIAATGTITGLTGISSSGTITLSGLNASLPVFTDASKNLTNTGTVDVSHGGTGVGSITANGVVLGNGTSAITTATGTSAQFLVANGSNVPSFVTMSNDATISNTGALTIANNAVTGAKVANNTLDFAQFKDAMTLDAATSVSFASGGFDYTLGDNTGNGGLVVAPNAGGKAALIINKQGINDIFTASASGTTRLTLSNTGNLNIVGGAYQIGGINVLSSNTLGTGVTTSSLTTVGTIATGTWQGTAVAANFGGTGLTTYTQGDLLYAGSTNPTALSKLSDVATGSCLTSGGVGAAPTWTACSSLGTNYWSLNGSTISPFNGASNVAIGGNNTTAIGSLDIRANSGTTSVATVSGKTSFASLVVDNSGTGDLFTASSSGLNRFVITQNGNVGIGTTTPSSLEQIVSSSISTPGGEGQFSNYDLTLWNNDNTISHGTGIAFSNTPNSNNVGAAIVYGSTNSNAQGYLKFMTKTTTNNGGGPTQALFITDTSQVIIGTNNTALGTFDVRGNNGTQPIATFSGTTSFAGLVVNNSGVGPIFAASSSGVSQFTIANNGILTDAAYGTGIAHFNSSGVLSSSAVALGGTDVSGLLPVTKGGTGTDLSSGAAVGDLLYADSTTTFHRLSDVATGSCLISGGTNTAPSWGSCATGTTNFWTTSTNNSNTVLNPATLTNELAVGTDGSSANFVPFSTLFVQSAINTKGNALVALNQTSSADIFTASSSGTTEFTINRNGDVGIAGSAVSASNYITAPNFVLNTSGQITTGTWQANAIGAQYGGTGIDTHLSTGVPSISSGTWSVNAQLPLSLGGTNANLTADNGGIVWSNGSALQILAHNANTGLALISGGAGTPSWFAPTQGSIIFAGANGALSQNNANFFWDNTNTRLGLGVNSSLLGTLDVRTTSGTLPVATISGATSFAGLVVDNSGLGDIFTASSSGLNRFVITQGGNVGIGTTTPGALLDVNGNMLLGANSTIDTRASGTLTIGSGSNTTGLTLGKSGATTTFNSTSWTATPTISGLVTANGGLTVASGQNLTLAGITGNNAVLYATAGTGVVTSTTTSSSNQCLLSGAGNAPSWGACALGTNYWQLSGSTISPATQTNGLAVGTTTRLAGTDLRSLSGTQATASISGTTSFAGLVVDNSGVGDIFTASSSGLNRFVISQNGNVGIGINNPSTNLEVSGSTSPILKITPLIGGSAGYLYINGGRALFGYNGTNAIMSDNGLNKALTFANGNGGPFERLRIDTGGNIGINTTSPLAILDVRGINGTNAMSGTIPIASISGQTSFASLVVDNSGVGPIFAASSSGVSQFTIANNGILTDVAYGTGIAHFNSSGVLSSSAVALGGTDVSGLLPVTKGGTGTDLSSGAAIGDILYADSTTTFHRLADVSTGSCLISGGVTTAPSWGSCGGTNYWQLNSGILTPATLTNKLSIGVPSNITSLATFDLRSLNGTQPVASISGATSFAGLVVDNSGLGDIFTASSSGLNRFVITQSGNVGIGTTNPSSLLQLTGATAATGGTGAIGSTALQTINVTGGIGGTGGVGTNGGAFGGAAGNGGNGSLLSLAAGTGGIGGAGGTGTNTPGASGNGGVGGQLTLTSGTGGAGTNGTNGGTFGGAAGTGGTAGSLSLTTGNGGIGGNGGTGSSNSGGAGGAGANGGNLLFTAGNGGNGGNGGTDGGAVQSNGGNGGGGGSIYLTPGSGGSGGTKGTGGSGGTNGTSGSAGNIFLAVTQGGTAVGQVGIGNNTPLATLDIRPSSGTIAVASISGATSFAAQVVDNSGLGDIFSASSSGLGRFTIQQNGTIIVGNDGNPVATTIRGGTASGSNISGANVTLDASNGTGGGGSGDLIFRTAPAAANSAVTLDQSASTNDGAGGAAHTFTWTNGVTISSGHSNNLLIVGITVTNTNTISTVTYNGSGMTFLTGANCPTNVCRTEWWYLTAPTADGAGHSVVVTMSAANTANYEVGYASYYNVNQTTPLTAGSTHSGTTSGGQTFSTSCSCTLSVSTSTDQVAIDLLAADQTVNTPAQTQLWNTTAIDTSASSYAAGTGGNINFNWTANSAHWIWMGATINPVSNSLADTLTDRLHITAAGNVGLGTSTPVEKLDVEGGNIEIGQQTNTSVAADTTWSSVSQSTAGTISTGGTTAIASISAMAVYNGSLYVGTHKTGAAQVYRYNGTTGSWTVLNGTAGTFNTTASIDEVSSMIVYDGYLYIGTSKANSAEVYRYNSGTSWTALNNTAGSFDGGTTSITAVSAMAVNAGRLYIGTFKTGAGEVYRYNGSTGTANFLNVSNAPGSLTGGTTAIDKISAMASYNGMLWAATTEGNGQAELDRFTSGSSWLTVNGVGNTSCGAGVAGTFCINGNAVSGITAITSMAVYNGRLYLGMRKSGAGDLMYMEETGTNQVSMPNNDFIRPINAAGTIVNGGTTIDSVSSLTVYNGKLYAGTEVANKAEVFRYESGSSTNSSWTKVSQATAGTIASGGTASINMVANMIPYNGSLFLGTFNPAKAEVYTYTVVNDQSYALKFHAGATPGGGEQNSLLNVGSISFMASGSANMNGTTNSTGAFLFSNGIQTNFGAYDVAEDYGTRDDTLAPGDIVSLDTNESNMVKKSSGSTDTNVIGIYSTNPGFRLSQQDATINGGQAIPVALSGRVPVKVTTENGAIEIGDLLTSSSIPGVAMKATASGMIIGKAMETYTNTDKNAIGQVMTFINITWANPAVQLTGNGNLNIAGSLPSDIKTNIDNTGVFNNNLTSTMLTTASPSATLSPMTDSLSQLGSSVALLQTQYASLSAHMGNIDKIDDLSQKIATLEKNTQLFSASSAANITDTNDATISGQLSVLGKTLLSDVGITGKVTMGVLTIDGLNTDEATPAASIDTIAGPLRLQSLGLNGIDILKGKIVINTNGDIQTQGSITAKKYNIDTTDVLSTSLGEAIIQTGQSFVEIKTTAVTKDSKIFVTPENMITQPLIVSSKKPGISFTVEVASPVSQSVKFNWWIVN